MKWRRLLLPGLTLAVLLFLNLRNQCQAGWCSDYGFPFVYRHWSDEIPVINGVTYGPWFSASALAADIAIGLAAVMASVVASSFFTRTRAHAAA